MPARVAGIHPLQAIESGRISIKGSGFPIEESAPPAVRIGDAPARVVFASPSRLDVIVPAGLEGGRATVRVEGVPGETAFVDIAAPFATGLHQVDNPIFDPEGHLYVSSRFEGTVYRVARDGSVEVFANDLGIPCGLAFATDGTLFVGDRSGTIFRVDRTGEATTFATLPASVAAFHLAYGPDDRLYVTGPTL